MGNDKLYFNYSKGQEKSEVVEREGFTTSIFSEQYSQALRLIDSALSNYQEGACQVIAFCGDRGEGKSSCLKTIHGILKKAGLHDESECVTETGSDANLIVKNYLKELEIKDIQSSSFEVLDIIDPAFFDKGHNVQEMVVGQMYTRFRKEYSLQPDNRNALNKVLDRFEKVKRCVTTLKKNEIGEIDEYDELETLAFSMTLRADIEDLIVQYLSIIGKKDGKLLVTIDDIDLNMEEAYKMCEQIRKYFSNRHTIILLAVKEDQLHQAVSRALKKSSDPSDDLKASADIMAEKYLAKFIPVNARINMPSIFELTGRYLRIGQTEYDGHTIMDTILELVFQRTRYLFYNSMGVVSPLIPTNLRGFLQLLALLGEMHNLDAYEDDKENPQFKHKLEENKHQFKNYFFNEWRRKLGKEYQKDLQELIGLTEYTLFNKKACSILSQVTVSINERSYEKDDDSEKSDIPYTIENDINANIKNILSSANFAYNVTIGDVFYIISMLEKVDLPINQQYLLFFIKSLYSMRLYEAYDTVTERNDDIYSSQAAQAGIYRYDRSLTDTNELQRLVGGGYFSYAPGTILGFASEFHQFFDCFIIDTSKGVNQWVEDAKDIVSESVEEFIKKIDLQDETLEQYLEFNHVHDQLGDAQKYGEEGEILLKKFRAFNALEFIALSTCQWATQKEIERNRPDKLKGNYRKNVTPCFLTKYKKTPKKYLVFDILAPFANLVNPKFSYSRWDEYIPNFFNIALQNPLSLLRKMIGEVVLTRLGENDYKSYLEKIRLSTSDINYYLHLLQSDAIIRNGEVLAAMFENVASRRYENKVALSVEYLPQFYNEISPSYMSTYKKYIADKEGYRIQFSFLKGLGDTISAIIVHPELLSLLNSTFTKVVISKDKANISNLNSGTIEERLFNELRKLMSNRQLSGAAIRDLLSKELSQFTTLSGTEKLSYVRTKKGETFDVFKLFKYVTASSARFKKWCTLFGIE